AALMVRVVDSVAATEARLREIVAGRGEIDLGHRNEPQTLYVPAGEEGVVVAFNTDIPWLASLGRPLLFGPGSILHAHGPEERIGRQELLSAVDTYGRLVHDLLAGRLYS
ncbi:MAG: peptidase dimerization protein, partial [Acidobacteriota bacterium]